MLGQHQDSNRQSHVVHPSFYWESPEAALGGGSLAMVQYSYFLHQSDQYALQKKTHKTS